MRGGAEGFELLPKFPWSVPAGSFSAPLPSGLSQQLHLQDMGASMRKETATKYWGSGDASYQLLLKATSKTIFPRSVCRGNLRGAGPRGPSTSKEDLVQPLKLQPQSCLQGKA